jgi:peptidoglycan/LPS O-acetylase OafA/YrhL
MPKPTRPGQRYMPGLDGLRAVAVLAVIAYHEQFGWALGGLLGVGVFFTLSGYLITSILLSQWLADGRLHLREFWLGRARRLLPALFVMLGVVTAWVTLADRSRLASLRGAVAAAATYSSNWYAIVQQQSYFARFAPAGPLDHLWSLAVEEQFYLIWPGLLLLGLALLRGRRTAAVAWLALPTLAMAAASAAVMAALYQPGPDPTRVYEGTDTRAAGLLIGAALAMVLAARRRPGHTAAAGPAAGNEGRPPLLVDLAGLAGLAGIGVLIWRTGEYSPFLYRGGIVVLSVATAAVVAAVACPGSLIGAALGWRPLRWIGARSYGIYLWHYPVIVLTTPQNATEDLPRAALQIAASVIIAALSWRFVEEPVRHGAIGRAWAWLRAARPAGAEAEPGQVRRVPARGVAALTGAAGVLIVAGAGLSGFVPAPKGGGATAAAGSVLPLSSRFISRAGQHPQFAGGGHRQLKNGATGQAKGTTGSATAGGGSAASGSSPSGAPVAGQQRTSCQSVAHLGDSTSDGLVSPAYLPEKSERIQARYEDVGARSVWMNIAGGRSIVEVIPGTVNGYDAAVSMRREGFRGCWVLALGTDDTADVAAGSATPLAVRIARMMAATRGMPVLWVNVKTLVSSGPYAESNMLRWNAALVRACPKYPNMRIYNWAAAARPGWFISDGIHYTSAGYKERAELIADALAKAFPAGGHSSGCVVS